MKILTSLRAEAASITKMTTEDPRATARYTAVNARGLLRESVLVDPWFLGRFGLNLVTFVGIDRCSANSAQTVEVLRSCELP
jgi:hypothetical protein